MTESNERPINRKAKLLAEVFIAINILMYVLFYLAFIFEKTDWIDEQSYIIIGILTYGSYVFSLLIACVFRIAPKNKKTEVLLVYFSLLVINVLPLIFLYILGEAMHGYSLG